MITGEQVRAARKLLGWSQVRLAGQSGVKNSAISKFEMGARQLSEPKVATIGQVLVAAGIEFTNDDGPGVKLRKGRKMITGERVKAARKLLGWSQLALALEAGVTQGTVANFETGKKHPSVLSVSTVQAALESAGVEFTYGAEPGVKLKAKARTIAAENLNASNDE
jgi:transcriptional regulator with XRE-family HTH domain